MYGRRGKRATRAVAQYRPIRAIPSSLETHLVRKLGTLAGLFYDGTRRYYFFYKKPGHWTPKVRTA